MKVKIGIACDDIGFERKEEVRHYLEEVKGMEVVYDPVKVPADGQNTCGTGIGFTCQANKHWGIRAVAVSNPYTAQRARLSNNAQIIGLGCRVLGMEYTKMVLDAWLDNPFDFATARENSKKNLLEAKKNDDLLLKKPDYIAWNMGFEAE